MSDDVKIGPLRQKDLARMLNISTMTVSKALRNHPDVSIKTRKLVQEFAKKMDYYPNYVARNLSVRKTSTIGVIMPKIAHSFYSAVLDGIQTVAEEKGYEIILAVSRESAKKEEKHFLSLISMRVDGLLLSVTQETHAIRVEDLGRMGTPLVFFDRALDNSEYSSVKVDDRGGAKKAVEHAIKLGYKNIVHFAGYQNVDISRNRLNGYLEAMREHQIQVRDDMIIECGFGEKVGYNCFMDIFKKNKIPEVIFTVSDSVALGVYRAAREMKVRIGKDVGLIGFTDINVASILVPALTTIHEPAELMGKKAVKLLIEEIEKKENRKVKRVMLPTELIIRESCGESN
jgi:LacI family transcriptional regulator